MSQQFNINMICYESYPCQHYCWYGTGEDMVNSVLMNGKNIEKILREEFQKTGKIDMKIYSHFADYKDVVNIFDDEIVW